MIRCLTQANVKRLAGPHFMSLHYTIRMPWPLLRGLARHEHIQM